MSRCLCITYDKGKWGSKVISKMAEFRCQDFKWPITSEIQTHGQTWTGQRRDLYNYFAAELLYTMLL